MNKKLLSLAVAAAVAAPTAAMAEAVLYGKLHQSIDYQDVSNAIGPTYDEVEYFNVTGIGPGSETTTATNIYASQAAAAANAGPGTPGFVAQAEDVPAWVNSTGGTVYVPLADGTVAEVQDGTLIEGVTSSTTSAVVPGPDGEMVTLIRTDANGQPIINDDGQDFTGWGISREGSLMQGSSRANRLGVKGSEDLGNGLKAIYQVELGLNLTAADDAIASGNNGISYRNSFVGLAGAFGTVLAGRHDTPLKISSGKLDMFSDTMADYNGTVGFDDVRADNVVAYISPSFNGVSFAGAVVAPGGATVNTFGGGDTNIDNDSLASAYSLALIYNNGPFYGSAAYEVLGNDHFMDSDTALAGKCAADALTCNYVDDDYSKWRLGLGLLDWNGFSLTAIYEQQDDRPDSQIREAIGFVDPDGNVTFDSVAGGAEEQRLWQVQAGYSFGNNMVKAMYGAVDRDADKPFSRTRDTLSINNITDDLGGDRETWAIGFDHNFSKRTKAYALYVDVTDDSNQLPGGANEFNGFSLGVVHKF